MQKARILALGLGPSKYGSKKSLESAAEDECRHFLVAEVNRLNPGEVETVVKVQSGLSAEAAGGGAESGEGVAAVKVGFFLDDESAEATGGGARSFCQGGDLILLGWA